MLGGLVVWRLGSSLAGPTSVIQRERHTDTAPRARCVAGDRSSELTREERRQPCSKSLPGAARTSDPVIAHAQFGAPRIHAFQGDANGPAAVALKGVFEGIRDELVGEQTQGDRDRSRQL